MDIFSRVGSGYLLRVRGSEFEQGKQQGEQAAHLIAANVVRFKKSLAQFKMMQSEYQDLIRKNLGFLEKAEPGVVAEMKGISEGANIPFEDILLINIPLYFILRWLPQECSSILARGQATFDGKTYLVKNRDMGGDRVEHVILHREYEDGGVSIEVNGAGIVTYPGSGLNKHGLAVSTSGVWSKQMTFDLNRADSAHALLNARLILEKCRDIHEAIDYLKAEKRMSGMNFVFADHKQAAAVEVTVDNVYVSPDEDGIIVRSNHYLTPDIAHLNQSGETYPSSYRRYERATSYLMQKHGQIKFQDMLEIASDHEHGPINTICRHSVEEGGAVTIYTSITVLEDSQVWTTLTNPCEALRVAYI
ncbi:C45 family autoproteolytic acyltransferase/hydolase [Paenibacillus hamazuiensis]|uniref:C45 family autoproteolytic acyltransferase/hydolase n=1 Tax=Paenibacillus hamazuiensis TaxID=2936508 RepID=UPI00200E2C34|nr:C45 family peptidase [Paenibacillus hamazuiensis]